MRVSLVISSMALGGAQRVLAWLAGGLAERGHAVSLHTFEHRDAAAFFALNPAITRLPLDLLRPSAGILAGVRANAERLRTLRASLRKEKPDVVLSFMDTTNILTIMALLGTGIPVLASERTNPAEHRIGAAWRMLRRLAYPLAAGVVAQTETVRRLLPGRTCAIPNPVSAPNETARPDEKDRLPEVVALGRLAPEKGFDLLLRAFARVAQDHPQWRLRIVGEGPEAQRLESLRAELGLEGRVLLPGGTPDPMQALRQADLFVLSSRYEGFPNALCEALACGLPCVAFDCPSGPAEILRHRVDGLLVPPGDVSALAQAMRLLMADPTLRQALAARAPEVLERFGAAGVLDRWEALLQGAAERRTGPCAA